MKEKRHSGFPNHYVVLGLPAFSSDLKAIKASYRALARQYHPDALMQKKLTDAEKQAAEQRFLAIQAAYDSLSDADKKTAYDSQLKIYLAYQQKSSAKAKVPVKQKPPPVVKSAPPPVSPPPSNNPPPPVSPPPSNNPLPPLADQVTMSAGKGSAGKGLQQLWGKMWEQAQARQQQPAATSTSQPSQEPLRLSLALTEAELKTGCVKPLAMPHKTLEVKIPSGLSVGSKIRLSGEGPRHPKPPYRAADVIITLQAVETAPEVSLEIRQEGLNTFYTASIGFPQAVLGTVVQVPKLAGGTFDLTIPPMSEHGRKFRLKGQGASEKGKTGDYFVTLHWRLPTALTKEQRVLYESLCQLDNG